MKKSIVILMVLATSLLAGQEDNRTKAIWGIGAEYGSYGSGIYFRSYSDNSFWQVTGVVSYEQGNDYSSYEPIDKTNKEFSLSYLTASIGLKWAHYLYHHEMESKNGSLIPTSVAVTLGGSASHFTQTEYKVAAGILLEFAHPNAKGLIYSMSVDYGVAVTTPLYIGPMLGAGVGFNF